MAVEKYYNEDKTMVGVLVSPGYGAGWSTWYDPSPDYDKKRFDLATDRRIIDWWLEHAIPSNTQAPTRTPSNSGRYPLIKERIDKFHEDFELFLNSIGYTNVFLGGCDDLELRWIEVGRKFRIAEYDGSEYLLFLDEMEFVEA